MIEKKIKHKFASFYPDFQFVKNYNTMRRILNLELKKLEKSDFDRYPYSFTIDKTMNVRKGY